VLSGTDLFLATSFAATPDFGDPTHVPPQFTGTELTVPHPVNGVLYFKLRDDPATVQTLTLAVMPLQTATLPPVPATPVAEPASPATMPADSSQGQATQGTQTQPPMPQP